MGGGGRNGPRYAITPNRRSSPRRYYAPPVSARVDRLLSAVELPAHYRATIATTPLFKYDYKAGDYFPKQMKVTAAHLLTTLQHLNGSRQAL